MRCSHCDHDNPEGLARCEVCNTPLTAYSGQVTGEVNAVNLERLARMSIRPPIVPGMTGLLVAFAIFGPFAAVISRYLARTTTNVEGTNYASAAFGAVGIAFTALVMIPLGLFLLYMAWLTWTRGSWIWMANTILLGAVAFLSLTGFLTSIFILRVLLIALCGAAGYFWFRPETREWYGA